MKPFTLIFCIIIFSQLCSCVKYEKKALIPLEVLQEIERNRTISVEEIKDPLTFTKSAEIMSTHNLQLKTVMAEYETHRSIAEIHTPLPNPNLELGANLGTPLSSISKKIVPFVAIGFTIPLGGKLKKQDELNKAKAIRQFVETQIQHRKLYLQLRESFISVITLKQKKIQQEKIISSAKLLEKTFTLLRETGGFDLLDLGIIELNNLQTKTNQFDLDLEYKEALSTFSILLGVENSLIENIDILNLPPHKTIPPIFEELKQKMIQNHFLLATLRYDYLIAEKSLRLEISKQYPDIIWGAEHEQEVSDKSKIFGLRLGINLPIFDRNQQGISQAFNEREVVKKSYEQTVNEALSILKKNFDQLIIQIEKNRYIQEVLLKKAEQNLMIAEKNLKVGAIDILKYLEVVRAHQEISISALNSENELFKSWISIEDTIGFPLLEFPNEGGFNLPLFTEED